MPKKNGVLWSFANFRHPLDKEQAWFPIRNTRLAISYFSTPSPKYGFNWPERAHNIRLVPQDSIPLQSLPGVKSLNCDLLFTKFGELKILNIFDPTYAPILENKKVNLANLFPFVIQLLSKNNLTITEEHLILYNAKLIFSHRLLKAGELPVINIEL